MMDSAYGKEQRLAAIARLELLLRNEYLVAENRIVKARIQRRLRMSEGEKATLAEIAKRLGRKALANIAGVAKPDILLTWYRKLVAPKFDGSTRRGSSGRPRLERAIEELVVKLTRENCGGATIGSSAQRPIWVM